MMQGLVLNLHESGNAVSLEGLCVFPSVLFQLHGPGQLAALFVPGL